VHTLYATSNSGEVFVINTKTAKVSSTITVKNPVDAEFGFPALTPDGGFLYVPVLQFNGGVFNGQSLGPPEFVDKLVTSWS
jgi:YVTN family beta-propeller protein